MAYTNDNWRFQVRGALAGGESWSNTWSAIDTVGGQDAQDFVDLLHDFYEATFASEVVNDTTAVACKAKNLGTEDSFDADWDEIVGDSALTPLPTECSVRLSLSTSGTARGGPFLAGYGVGCLDSEGKFEVAEQTIVLNALADFNTAVVAAGWLIAIDRPTTSVMVAASKGRVGRVVDVIRKRRNDIPESYGMTNLGE